MYLKELRVGGDNNLLKSKRDRGKKMNVGSEEEIDVEKSHLPKSVKRANTFY